MSQFEKVREQLLRAGIAPRHARRYVTELQEHLADLTTQERASGLNATQAQQRARSLLGSDEQLAETMLRCAPRSLAVRAPWSVFVVLPVVLLVLAMVIASKSMFQLLWPMRDVAPAAMPAAYQGLIAVVSFVTSYLIGPLLACMCIVVALRQRLMSRWIWVGLGLIALLSGPLGFQMHLLAADGGGDGGAVFSAARIVWQHGRPDLAATLGVALLRAVILFAAATIAYRLLRQRLGFSQP
jgi:hypothetical protein